jgi:hypothetical protein
MDAQMGVARERPRGEPIRQLPAALFDAGASISVPFGVDLLAQLVAVQLLGGAVRDRRATPTTGGTTFLARHRSLQKGIKKTLAPTTNKQVGMFVKEQEFLLAVPSFFTPSLPRSLLVFDPFFAGAFWCCRLKRPGQSPYYSQGFL